MVRVIEGDQGNGVENDLKGNGYFGFELTGSS